MVRKVGLAKNRPPQQRVLTLHGNSGNLDWMHTHEQAITFLESGQFSYHIQMQGRAVPLVVAWTGAGQKYLKAATDGEVPQHLLELPVIQPAEGQ